MQSEVAILTMNREKLRHQIRRAAKFGPRRNRAKLRRQMKSMLAK